MRLPPFHVLAAGVLVAMSLALRLWDPAPIARLRLLVFDSYARLSPRVADPGYPVKIVAIDEASLASVGQWPWPRTKLAELIGKLRYAGARTITFDILLAEPDRMSPRELAKALIATPGFDAATVNADTLPSNDDIFAAAAAGGNVILGIAGDPAPRTLVLPPPRASYSFAGDDPKGYVPAFAGGVTNLPALDAAAAGLGAVNWLPSEDQVVRRVPMLLGIGGTLYPSLSLEALRVAGSETTILIKSSGSSGMTAFGQKTGIELIRVGSTFIPTDAKGELWLHPAPADATRYISASSVLDGTAAAGSLNGRHVLIGASAAGLLDLRATALEAAVPGVELHAQALEQILSGDHVVRPAYALGAELTFLLLLSAGLVTLIADSRAVLAAVLGAGSVAATMLASFAAYAHAGLLFDPLYPSIAAGLIYTVLSLRTYVQSERARARIRSAFRHYIAPDLVDELVKNPDKLQLGGETREVTLLFADVRGFSEIAEGRTARDLIEFLNELFTPLSEAILAHRGTIDKFMGDAVMAFWNAPVTDPDHAKNACRAALLMRRELERMNTRWQRAVAGRGETFKPIRIGIGLNTGSCCVGNVGSPERFDYSILGDPVNVASRLEEATKTFGPGIIAGSLTAAQAQGFAFLDLGVLTPRGREAAERIYALVGDETVAASPAFSDVTAALSELERALGVKDAASAARALERCQTSGFSDLEPMWAILDSRIAQIA